MKFKIPWTIRSHDFTEIIGLEILNFINSKESLTQGKYLKLFENRLKQYLKIKEGDIFVVNSGTSALELIASLLHIQSNDEIIIPAHTFCATAIPFLRRGAKIIWADIESDTWVIDYNDVKNKITPNTKAIVLVHLYGLPCDIDKFKEFGITLIEDAAQSFGAEYKREKVGVLTDFGAFSFHAQKNMTTLGEGGAIYVRDKNLAELIPQLRSFGQKSFEKQYNYWEPATVNVTDVLGYELPFKYTLSEIQCLVGYKMLDIIELFNTFRKYNYNEFKASIPELTLQYIPKDRTSSYSLLPAYYLQRNKLMHLLAYHYGIQVMVQYYPLYKYDLFKKFECDKANCPNTDKFFDNMLSFPFNVNMSREDFIYMINSTKEALKILSSA